MPQKWMSPLYSPSLATKSEHKDGDPVPDIPKKDQVKMVFMWWSAKGAATVAIAASALATGADAFNVGGSVPATRGVPRSATPIGARGVAVAPKLRTAKPSLRAGAKFSMMTAAAPSSAATQASPAMKKLARVGCPPRRPDLHLAAPLFLRTLCCQTPCTMQSRHSTARQLHLHTAAQTSCESCVMRCGGHALALC